MSREPGFSKRPAGDRPLGLCSCHSSLGHLGVRGWVKPSMPRDVFPSPSHRCCVHNVQRLYQENSSGCRREVAFPQPGGQTLTAMPAMLLIKEFCGKSVSSLPGGQQSKGMVVAGGGLRVKGWKSEFGPPTPGQVRLSGGRRGGALDLRAQKPSNSQASQLRPHPKHGRGQDASGEWGQ